MEFKEFTLNLAQQAAAIMKKNFAQQMDRTWKEDHTPVTATDLAINRLVVDSVAETYPTHSVLGEEESSESTLTEYVWVCDPVDGTTPFSQGVPISTFSLALTKNGESILGVVVDPFLDRTFFAEKGKGAFLNNQPISVSNKKDLEHTVIDLETFPAAIEYLPSIGGVLERMKVKITSFCSFVYPTVSIAYGGFTASIFTGKTPWDVAAIKVIIEEAGGKVTDMYGDEQKYNTWINGCIASNGHVHEELVHIVAECREIDQKKTS